MNIQKKLLATFLSIFLLVSVMPLSLAVTVAATGENRTVYVSYTGSDDTGDGTIESPYASLSKAMTVIEADADATEGTIIISDDNGGAGISFTAAAHTKMITVEGITSSIVLIGSGNTKYKNICGPLTFDDVEFKNLGLNPRGHQLVLKGGVTFTNGITNIHTGKTESGGSVGTVSGENIYIDTDEHATASDDLYLTIGKDAGYIVNGDVNVYINNIIAQGVDIERGTYNGNVNFTVNKYQITNDGDPLYFRNNGTVDISGALQVVLNNGVTTGKYKANFRDGGPTGRTWLLYGQTAADGTILEMSDTVGVYNVKGGMTANAYKVTTSTNDFATDTISETAVISSDGVLDLRETGAGEYYIRYTYNRTVYVSTDGSDDTGDGTIESPYANLSKAMTVIEADDAAIAGTIIITGDNSGSGIAFTSAAHTKMITVEGITSSILIDASNSGTWRQTQGPLTFDNISVKRLGLEPRGNELVLKEGVILEGASNNRLNVRAGYNTTNGDTIYMGAWKHDAYDKDVYMYIGSGTVTGDLNIYIDDIYSKSVDLRNATYNGNVNLTVNNYRKSSNSGDNIWVDTSATFNGALQVILNNGVRNIHKDRFRTRTPSGGKWLLYGETAADGTILEMSDTVGVYNVKGGMTANAYKVTTSTDDFATDTISETAVISSDGVLDLRETGAGEYYIKYIPVEFKMHSLVLTDAIGVNFFMDLSFLSEAEKSASYMTFEVTNGSTKTAAFNGEFMNSTGDYYGFTCPISSVGMAETITPTFHYTSGGVAKTYEIEPYSVTDYIDYVNSHTGEFSASVVALVKAIGNYGYYAQQYFTSKTATAIDSEYRVSTYTSSSYSDRKTYTADKAITQNLSGIENGNTVGKFQYNLNLDSTTSILVKFNTANVNFTVTKGGNAYEDKVNAYTASECTLYLLHLPISQLGDNISISGTADGNPYSMQISGLTYVYGALDKDGAGTTLKNLACALCDYYTVARAYSDGVSLPGYLTTDYV